MLDYSESDPSAAEAEKAGFETLRLYGIVRNVSALAALVLAYSMDWMDLAGSKIDPSDIRASGISVSAPAGGRQSIVLKPGDMEVFGVPLTLAFLGLLAAAILRVVYRGKKPLHPGVPLALALPGTVMLCTVVAQAIGDETVGLFTSGFYIALAACLLNTVFDAIEWMDWRALKRRFAASGS